MPSRKVYKSNGNSKDRTPPKYRHEDFDEVTMTNSKKDSELEKILEKLVDRATCGDGEPLLESERTYVTEALQAIKVITKEESDRRVLEGRIDELGNYTYAGASRWELLERIAELRELLNGDKDG